MLCKKSICFCLTMFLMENLSELSLIWCDVRQLIMIWKLKSLLDVLRICTKLFSYEIMRKIIVIVFFVAYEWVMSNVIWLHNDYTIIYLWRAVSVEVLRKMPDKVSIKSEQVLIQVCWELLELDEISLMLRKSWLLANNTEHKYNRIFGHYFIRFWI